MAVWPGHRDRRRDRPFDAGAASGRESVQPGAKSCGDPRGLPEDGSNRASARRTRAPRRLDGGFPPGIPAMSLVNTVLQPESRETAETFAGTPLSGDAVAPAVRGEIAVSLPMRHAGTRELRLRYEVQGPADAPAVFVAGGISAHR